MFWNFKPEENLKVMQYEAVIEGIVVNRREIVL